MKIVYVSEAMFPREVSHTLSIMKMCQAFADSGHDVLLVGKRKGPAPVGDLMEYYGLRGGFRVQTYFYSSPHSRFDLLRYAQEVKRVVDRERPDLVYSRLTLTSLFRIPPNIPLIYEMHGAGNLGKGTLRRWAFEYVLKSKRIDRIVVTTHMLKTFLEARYPRVQVTVARLSAEPPKELDPQEVKRFKAGALQGQYAINVGYTGFLDNEGRRGMDVVCDIAQQMPDLGFHMVGGAPDMVAHWSRHTASRGMANIYWYGYQRSNLIPWYLKSFDVVLAPLQLRPANISGLWKNMSPLKLPQYLGYRCAIVASDIPAHREILMHREHALLCPPDNIGAWVAAIRELTQHEALRQHIQHAAGQAYAEEFTPEIRVGKILSGLHGKGTIA